MMLGRFVSVRGWNSNTVPECQRTYMHAVRAAEFDVRVYSVADKTRGCDVISVS